MIMQILGGHCIRCHKSWDGNSFHDCPAPVSPCSPSCSQWYKDFKVGEKVKKITGDYSFDGTVVAVFNMMGGAKRFVVEHDEHHMLHIFNEKNLEIRI